MRNPPTYEWVHPLIVTSHTWTCIHTERERERERETERQRDRDRQTDRQTDRLTQYITTCIHNTIDIQYITPCTQQQREQRDRHADRDRQTQTDRERDRDIIHTYRQTDRQTDIHNT